MSGIVGQNLGRGSGLVKVTAVDADSVTGASIADDAIDSEHYTDGSIDNAHIADNAIDSEHYADGSIDNAHIADDAIDSEHYAAASIDNAHLADNAADTAEIADNAITLAKMAGGTDGNIISYDASGDPVAIATGSDGEVLTSTGAGSPPAFEAAAGGGALVFLEGVDGDQGSATTINFTQVFSSAYNMYRVIGSFQIAAGSDLYCLWLDSADAEQDDANYFTTMKYAARADGGGDPQDTHDGFWDPHEYGFIVGNAHGGDTDYKHSIDFVLHPDHDPSSVVSSSYHGTYGGTTNTGSVKRTIVGNIASIYENTADLTGGGFCIKAANSNFDFADIAIYGIKNS